MRNLKYWIYIYIESKSSMNSIESLSEEEKEKVKQFHSIIDENERKAEPIRSQIVNIHNLIKTETTKMNNALKEKTSAENERKRLYEVKSDYEMKLMMRFVTDTYTLDEMYEDIEKLKDIIRKINKNIKVIENEITNLEEWIYDCNKELNKFDTKIGEASDELDKILWKDRNEETKRFNEQRDKGLDDFDEPLSTGKHIKPEPTPEPTTEPKKKSMFSRFFGGRGGKNRSKKGGRRRRGTRKHRK